MMGSDNHTPWLEKALLMNVPMKFLALLAILSLAPPATIQAQEAKRKPVKVFILPPLA